MKVFVVLAVWMEAGETGFCDYAQAEVLGVFARKARAKRFLRNVCEDDPGGDYRVYEKEVE